MKVIVLSSGGCDSTTCLAMAVEIYGRENVSAMSVDYGQRHAKELEAARVVAEHYRVEHFEIDLTDTGIFLGSRCPLLAANEDSIEDSDYATQVGRGVETYVPFRNGLFLSMMASVGMTRFDDDVVLVIGAHADDAAGEAYADCSKEFIERIDEAISIGTYGRVHAVAPFCRCTKSEIVRYGLAHGVPYGLTWSCYHGREKHCGVCATCRDRRRAFRENGAEDPVDYEVTA